MSNESSDKPDQADILENLLSNDEDNQNVTDLNGTDDIITEFKPESVEPQQHIDEDAQTAPDDTSKHNSSPSESSRKRKYEDDRHDRSNYKRSHNSSRKSNGHHSSSSEEPEVYLKLLIPSAAAGGIIGRGGEKIAQIQKDAQVKMKMSKANDYYPNTSERICLIIGSVNAVLKAHGYIIERIQEKPDSNKSGSVIDEDRMSQIKILIPNGTAGLLIGKGGAYIKQIKDDSGAFVQISTKQTDLPERIVMIEGNDERRNKALQMVVKKIAEDPQHNSVNSLNYSSNSVDNNGSNGANFGNGQNQSGGNKFDFNSTANYLAGLNNLATLIINSGGSFQMTADSIKNSLRNTGYNPQATKEIIESITILMSYGLITKMPPNSPGGLANLAGLAGLQGGQGRGNSYSSNHGNDSSYNSHHSSHNGHQHHHSGSKNGGMHSNSNSHNANGMLNVLQMLSNTLGKQGKY